MNGSEPIGTTVRVQDFFQHFPVRLQSALKNSAKYLARTKQLLEAYALVRPTVRFSLRVKGLTSASDWQYASKPGASVEDAAYKVVGRECVKECAWSVVESDGYVVQGFIPRADACPGKVSNHRAYLSIDSRPVSPSRVTLKQIVLFIKKRMREANETLKDVKEPFIYLNIVCPSASYDPNVEPAKDDVLFDDASKVHKVIEMMLDAHYPPASAVPPTPASVVAADVQQSDGYDSDAAASFSTALDAGDPAPLSFQLQKSQAPTSTVSTVHSHDPNPAVLVRSNMYAYDEDDLESILDDSLPVANEEEDVASARDMTVFNPWTIAKMNSAMRPRKPPTCNTSLVVTDTTGQLARSACLPTPQPSSPPRRTAESPTIDLEQGIGSFRQRVQSVRGTPAHRSLPPNELEDFDTSNLIASSQDDFVLSGIERPNIKLPPPPTNQTAVQQSARRHRQAVNKPSISPAHSQETYERHVWAFDPTSSHSMHSSRPKRGNRQHHLDLRDLGDQVPWRETSTEKVTGAVKSTISTETGGLDRDIRDFISMPSRLFQVIKCPSSFSEEGFSDPGVPAVLNKGATTKVPPTKNRIVLQSEVKPRIDVHGKFDEHVELAPKRRRTTDHGGLRRTMSLGVRLARFRTTGLVVTVCTTPTNLSVSLRRLEHGNRQTGARERAGADKGGFALSTNIEMREWSSILSERLGDLGEGDILSDLQYVFCGQ